MGDNILSQVDVGTNFIVRLPIEKQKLIERLKGKGISMLELKEKILSDGEIIEPDILKVDSFINHQIDPKTYRSIAKEIKRRFAGEKIDKILTIEASGIALGLALSYELNDIPVVLAKTEHLKQLMMIYIQVKYIHILKEQDILLALKRNI